MVHEIWFEKAIAIMEQEGISDDGLFVIDKGKGIIIWFMEIEQAAGHLSEFKTELMRDPDSEELKQAKLGLEYS